MAADLLVATVFTIVFILLLFSYSKIRRSLRLPPGPWGFPVLGALPLIGPVPHAGLANLAKRYGPIMYLKMGASGVVVASTASAARVFLTTFDVQFANRPSDIISAKDITYDYNNMAFANYNPRWKLFRKLSTLHMLSPKSLSDWTHVRRAEAAHMIGAVRESCARGEHVLVNDVLLRALGNIIGQVMISRRVFEESGAEVGEFSTILTELLTGGGLFNIGDFVPAIAWMDLQGVQAKMRRAHERLDGMIEMMLEEHAASAGEREGRPDFIDRVLASDARDDDGVGLSDVNIRALISDMFTAGTDTTTVVIEWALAEMLKNPTILHRVQSEMDGVIGRHRMLEESDIPNLPYLQSICKETLRLHPPTPLSLPHYAFVACQVQDFHLPANTRLLVNVWAIARDPDVWDRPLEFDPERFLSGKKAIVEPNGTDFELIPFGAGRRICVGKQAGVLFVQYLLGVLVHAFEWEVADGVEIGMEEAPGLVVHKAAPLVAVATPRLAASAYV